MMHRGSTVYRLVKAMTLKSDCTGMRNSRKVLCGCAIFQGVSTCVALLCTHPKAQLQEVSQVYAFEAIGLEEWARVAQHRQHSVFENIAHVSISLTTPNLIFVLSY